METEGTQFVDDTGAEQRGMSIRGVTILLQENKGYSLGHMVGF